MVRGGTPAATPKGASKVNGGVVVGVTFQENPRNTSNGFGLVMVHVMLSSVLFSSHAYVAVPQSIVPGSVTSGNVVWFVVLLESVVLV